jgi:hypothetical protein
MGAAAVLQSPTVVQLQNRFLAVLPRIERHARIYFRRLNHPHQREEALAECLALCWWWFVRLVRRGKDPEAFITVLASLAARAVASGRRLCGQERANEVLSSVAQRRHGFTVQRLHPCGGPPGSPWDEAIQDNNHTPVMDQVIFRVDFPAWRRSRTKRDQRIIDRLLLGERTGAVAQAFDLSPSRVAQLRRQFHATGCASARHRVRSQAPQRFSEHRFKS